MNPSFSLLIFLFLSFLSPSEQNDSVNCTGRRIYVRQLPPRFTTALLRNCSAFPLFFDFCPFLPNHALGPKTHPNSRSWFRTDPYMLELIFYTRFLHDYSCIAAEPSAADAVYVPYFGGIDSLRYLYGEELNSSHLHGVELVEYLREDSPEIWGRFGGLDHFLVMGRVAWDFTRPETWTEGWGTSALHLPEFVNMTAIVLESRKWAVQEQAVPHPTSFHPGTLKSLSLWTQRLRLSRRKTLMLFVGGGGTSGTPNIRNSIRKECELLPELCRIVDCSNGVCEHDPGVYMRPMIDAVFCLQPPGDTPTRRSTFDSFVAGCIPVFFEDLSAKVQFTWHLPEEDYDEFSVSIDKDEVVWEGKNISGFLLGISKEKVRRMREKVIELMPRVIYRKTRSTPELRGVKDAFDLAVEGALGRIRGRIAEVGLGLGRGEEDEQRLVRL